MRQSEQYLISGVIFGVIAFLMLAAAIVAMYGAFWGGGKPELVLVGGLFGMMGGGSTLATLYSFAKVL